MTGTKRAMTARRDARHAKLQLHCRFSRPASDRGHDARPSSIGRHSGTRLAFDLTDARRDPAWGRARRRRAQEGHDATTISRTARRTRWPARLAGAQRTRDPRRRRARHPGRSGAMAGSGRRVGLPPLRERGRRSGRLGQRVERTRGAAGRPAARRGRGGLAARFRAPAGARTRSRLRRARLSRAGP